VLKGGIGKHRLDKSEQKKDMGYSFRNNPKENPCNFWKIRLIVAIFVFIKNKL
jgi:hypothetical protein